MNAFSRDPGGDSKGGLLLTVPVCLLLIIIFLVSASKPPEEKPKAEPLSPAFFTPATAREEILPTKVMVGNCSICHAYWVGIPDPDVVRPRFAHRVVKLEHGANDRCYNCHLIEDRNKYTANGVSGIMHQNVEQLCARCHGLIYKDWQAGIHGVRRGQWNPETVFDVEVIGCTECHDPHSPKFVFKKFAPPPVWPKHFVRTAAGIQ